MQRILKLIPVRYDSYRDLSETTSFRKQLYTITNMIELNKLGGKISIPEDDWNTEALIDLYNKDKSESLSIQLMKRFNEANFMEDYYNDTKRKIDKELKELFDELFYKELGYPNFSHVCCKSEGGYIVATRVSDKSFKFTSTDKQTFDLLVYIAGLLGQASTLAIRNELIK